MQSMQRQCESQSYMKGFWAENCLGKELGNSELSFFFLLISHTDSKLLCYQNAKEYFFFFFFMY